jgi:hypothetical protein
MKNTLFIMTHLGSGWEKLASLLEEYPHIHVFQTGYSYGHPDDLSALLSQIHRRKSSAAIWADVVFHNKDFTMKRIASHYKFIFWCSSLQDCVDELVSKYKYKKNNAEDYWAYRMEGLKQYYKRTPNALWNPVLNKELVLGSIL